MTSMSTNSHKIYFTDLLWEANKRKHSTTGCSAAEKIRTARKVLNLINGCTVVPESTAAPEILPESAENTSGVIYAPSNTTSFS